MPIQSSETEMSCDAGYLGVTIFFKYYILLLKVYDRPFICAKYIFMIWNGILIASPRFRLWNDIILRLGFIELRRETMKGQLFLSGSLSMTFA